MDENSMSYVPHDVKDRGDIAVLASLTESGSNTRIVFDDVTRQGMVDGIAWAHRSLFTVADYPTKDLERLALSKDQFARIGENVVTRLLALTGKLKNGS